jgi:hypothetical protein
MTIPVPILDDRSFDQLVAEARARVPVHTPEWTNLNESDPGVTLLELFAFLTENLLYRSNRIPEANRLKFLTMLGIALQPPTPGIGLVTVTNEQAPLTPPPLVPVGTEMRAGQTRFLTAAPLAALPVTSAVYYKHPQALDDATLAQYRLIYQTFLTSDADVLTFYQPVSLDPPAPGRPDPVVDLGDPVNGTIDRALWIALLARPDAELSDVRRAIGGQTLSIGVYPAAAVPGQVLPPVHTGSDTLDPGVVVEIAAPEPDPLDPLDVNGDGLGVGPAAYTRLPVTYADPVLEAPGLIQVTLPDYEKLLLWPFDPEEEGTGDFPPRLDDAKVSARLVTWLRLRYPPLAEDPTPGPETGTQDVTAAATSDEDAPSQSTGCGCDDCSDTQDPVSKITVTSGIPSGQITWVGVNATRLVQSVAVRRESLGLAPGTPFHTCTLANTPVLADDLPGASAVTGTTVEVQSVDGTWDAWERIDDIYAAGRDQQAYTLDPATGVITFGSGLTGARPPRGAALRASYWYGGGPQGQVAIDAINRTDAVSGCTITNPLPTWGASGGESVTDGEAAITRWLRHRDRLVTADDFRDLTRRTPGVDLGRVEVLPLFNPDQTGPPTQWPGMVTVLVIPRSDPVHAKAPQPDRLFLQAVCAWLAPRRLVTTEVHVRGPVYRPVWVSIGVVALPGHLPTAVHQAVTAAVETFLSPLHGGLPSLPEEDGLLGAPDASRGTGWPLGVSLRVQDIEGVAARVPGVRYVESVQLAVVSPEGAVLSPVDTLTLTGLELPAATVFTSAPPAADPAQLIAGSQAVPATMVAVPFVPDTC